MDEVPPLASPSPRATVAVCIAMVVVGLNTTAITIATRGMAHDLGASMRDLEWIMGAYLIAAAAFALVGGRLGDVAGRTSVLLAGLAVFVVGSLAAAAAPDTPLLIAARAVQGLGAALIMPASIEMIVAYPPGRGASEGFRARGVVYATAFGLGPLLGGILTDNVSWRAVFVFEAVVALGAVAVAVPLLGRHSAAPKRPTRDLRGAALTVVATVLVVLLASQPHRWGWTSPAVFGCAALLAVTLLALRHVELHTHHPLVHPSLLRDRIVIGANVATLGASIAMVGLIYFFNLFAQSAVGFRSTAVQVGLTLVPFTVSIVVFAVLASLLSRRFSFEGPVVCGLGLAVLGFVALSRVTVGVTEQQILFPLVLCGVGAGIANAGLTNPAVMTPPRKRVDEAAGLVSLSRFLGSAIAIAIGTATYLAVGVDPKGNELAATGEQADAMLLGTGAFDRAVATLGADLRTPFEAAARASTVDAFASTMRMTAFGLALLTGLAIWLLRPRRDHPSVLGK